MSHKSDVLAIFTRFKLLVKTHFSCKIKTLQTDGGGEFQKLDPFLGQNGISRCISCPHTQQ